MKFNKIACIDPCGLTSPFKEEIFKLSDQVPFIAEDNPRDNAEIIRRIDKADCVLVSWNTRIDAEVLEACPGIKYIGMCCSLYDEQSANVDIATARKLGIVVKGVRDYGDEGTVEFIFAQLINLLKGLGPYQWKKEATELTGKKIGIIGMGTLGKMVAKTALHFHMEVSYFSRTRKKEIETDGIQYLALEDLVSQCEILTTHLPRNTILLREPEFLQMKKEAILINTSLGVPFELDAFLAWIGKNYGNFAIFDSPGYGNLRTVFENHPNILLTHKSSGFTYEAKCRLTEKVWKNMLDFLQSANHPIGS